MYNTSMSNVQGMPWGRQPVVLYEQTSVNGTDAKSRLDAEHAARFAGAFSIRSILSQAHQPQPNLLTRDRFRQNPACAYAAQSALVCCEERASSPVPSHLGSPVDMSPSALPQIQQFEAPVSSCGLILNASTVQDRMTSNLAGQRPRPKKSVKRSRTIFAPYQLQRLEKAFERQQYVAGEERRQLAIGLNLTETQVKVWFQNRRIRFRKQRLKAPLL